MSSERARPDTDEPSGAQAESAALGHPEPRSAPKKRSPEQTGDSMAESAEGGELVPAKPRTAPKRTPAAKRTPAPRKRTTPAKPRVAPAAKPAAKQAAPEVVAVADDVAVIPAVAEPTGLDEAVIVEEPAALDETIVTDEPIVADEPVVPVAGIPDPAPADIDSAIAELQAAASAAGEARPSVLTITGLHKRFGDTIAVDGVSLDVKEGSFYGIVGPNGAGKTTTLSMITGLLRPDAGRVMVHGVDAWADPMRAKHVIGVLPDKLRLFDRLTGAQFLHYAGTLRGLSTKAVHARSADLAIAFGIEDALDRLVADYSAGMTKKIALAAAMIHSPRLLVLDEPFESVDPVSAANVVDILQRYTSAGGTVVLSSHGMDMIQRVCDSVAIIVRGQVLASGTIDEVRGEQTLEERFVDLAGGRKAAEGMEWLHSFSD